MRNTRIAIGGAAALALSLWTAPAFTQGQPTGSGTYVCDGAVQAGPCHPGGDGGSGGSGESVIGYDHLDPSSAKGHRTTFVALALPVDAKKWHKYVFSTRSISSAESHWTADSAGAEALRRCEEDAGLACRILAIAPNACLSFFADGDKKAYFVGKAPIRYSLDTSDTTIQRAGERVAHEQVRSQCIKTLGAKSCPTGTFYSACSPEERTF